MQQKVLSYTTTMEVLGNQTRSRNVIWVKPRTILTYCTNCQNSRPGIAAQPEFWNDQTAAQQTLQELNDLKEHLQQYDQWQASLEDTRW